MTKLKMLCLLLAATLFLPSGPALAFDEDHLEALNGAKLHFRVRGADKSNPYLLILHGGPGFSAHMFYAWGTSIEKLVNVVYLDQRGCGQSERLRFENLFTPKPEEVKSYTIANLVKDIEAVRGFLKVDRWYILGHSWGGMLGLEYVSAYPAHVAGYIHMDGLVSVPSISTSICDAAEAKFMPLLQSQEMAKKLKADTVLKAVRQIRGLNVDDPQRLTASLQLATGPAGLYFAGDQAAGFSQFQSKIRSSIQVYGIEPETLAMATEPSSALMMNDSYLTRDDTPLLSKVAVPTLIINGRQDGVVTAASAARAHTAIRGSQLVILDPCGHFPFAEQPEKTSMSILSFIADHPLKK